MAKVEIEYDMKRTGLGIYSLRIDGKELPHATEASFTMRAGDVPYLTVELLVTELHVRVDDADAEIVPKVITTARTS